VSLQGRLAIDVKALPDQLTLDVTLLENLALKLATASLAIDQADHSSLISLQVGKDVLLDIKLAKVFIEGPIGFAGEPFTPNSIATFTWQGLKYHAQTADQTLPFEADIFPAILTVTDGDAKKTLFAFESLSGTIRGTVDGPAKLSRFSLRKGLQTTFTDEVRTQTVRWGLRAERVITAGSKIIDFRRDLVAKKAAQAELVFQGELTKIDSLQCAAKGQLQTTLLDPPKTKLTAVADEDDECIVGYFTKVDGQPVYQYQRL
jgi:hypothetical protein